MVAVGNGLETLFWLDNWLFNESIINFAIAEVDIVEKFKLLMDYWSSIFGWNWDKLHDFLPRNRD